MSLEGLYRACLCQIHGSEMGLGAAVVAVSVTLRTGAEAGLWLFHLTGVCDGHLSKGLSDAERGTRLVPACVSHTGGVMGVGSACVSHTGGEMGVGCACVSHTGGGMGVVSACVSHTGGDGVGPACLSDTEGGLCLCQSH